MNSVVEAVNGGSHGNSNSNGAGGLEYRTVQSENLSLGAMPGDVAESVFSRLDPKDLAACCCVSTSWRAMTSSCSLWRPLCRSTWGLTERQKPDKTPCQNYQQAFQAHADLYWPYRDLYAKARDTVEGLRAWAEEEFPEVAETMAPGATEADLQKLEEELGVVLPTAFRLCYLFCNGQWENLTANSVPAPRKLKCHGLLGGYSYTRFDSARLLPLRSIPVLMRMLPNHWNYGTDAIVCILVAASFNLRKLFFLNCQDGRVYVRIMSGELMPCVPQEGEGRDGFLRWLSEYLARLRAGVYKVRDLHDHPSTRGIFLFPETGPECSRAVTYGVEVRVSSLFLPERTVDDTYPRRYFAHSIRMRLLEWSSAQDNGPMTQTIQSCQLRTRHWLVHDGDRIVRNFHGQAVDGQYPELNRGGREIEYQTSSTISRSTGSIEGEISFVPGSLDHPLGPEFNAQLARVQFNVPSFIF